MPLTNMDCITLLSLSYHTPVQREGRNIKQNKKTDIGILNIYIICSNVQQQNSDLQLTHIAAYFYSACIISVYALY
jgi:hypothetical protein